MRSISGFRRSITGRFDDIARSLPGGVMTCFVHPITNAISEGFNSKIQAIKSDARGFRSFINYRARILFHCGKLSLLPNLPPPSQSQ